MHEAEPQNISSKSLPESQRLSALCCGRAAIFTTCKSTTRVHKPFLAAAGRADRETTLHGPALPGAKLRDRMIAAHRIFLSENRALSIQCLRSAASSRLESLSRARAHA